MNGNQKPEPGAGVLLLMIAACCLLLANLYYCQPVLAVIAGSLRLSAHASGAMVMAAQLGYIAGLLFLAPLGDVLENRKLCSLMALGAGLAAFAAALAPSAPVFLAAIFGMGLFASATQVLVVFAVSLGGAGRSGKILGTMACGLFLGIAASRPLASFITGVWGWRQVYLVSGAALFAASFALWRQLPSIRHANRPFDYAAVLLGMARALRYPGLLRNTIISSGAFFSFIMFWSCMPMHLLKNLGYPQHQVTLFTLAGLITPACMLLVGRLLDKGWGSRIMPAGLALVLAGWLVSFMLPQTIAIIVFGALLLDPSSSAVTVSVQQKILSNSPLAIRGRLNSLNISLNFLGGAAGGALGPWLLTSYGPHAVMALGSGLIFVLLCLTTFARGNPGV